jgi:D-sedoheptulose 7-phosphate isomerase
MDLKTLYTSEFEEHAAVMTATRNQLEQPFMDLVAAGLGSIRAGGKILFFGNGGSAADCQHLATELTIRFKKDRAPIAAISLSTDTSALTACGNDLGFDEIFARQIEALGKPEDMAIGISTSGNSENVIRGLRQANKMGITTAALGGKGGGRMNDIVDPYLVVPSDTTARIQEMHIMIGHMFCDALERELKLV